MALNTSVSLFHWAKKKSQNLDCECDRGKLIVYTDAFDMAPQATGLQLLHHWPKRGDLLDPPPGPSQHPGPTKCGEGKDLLQTLQKRLNKEWEFDYEQPPTWSKAKLLLTHLQSFADHGKSDNDFLPDIATFFNGLGLWSNTVEINLPSRSNTTPKPWRSGRKSMGKNIPMSPIA